MLVFLDDIRPCPDNFEVVRNPIEFKELISKKFEQILMISMDHDLGFWDDTGKEVTGYDLIRWLESEFGTVHFKIKVHSANPVGKTRMENVAKKICRT